MTKFSNQFETRRGFLHLKQSALTTGERGPSGGTGVVSKGIAFPASPNNTDLFHRTDHFETYQYESDTESWLSTDLKQMQFGNSGVVATANDLSIGGGVCDAAHGPSFPWTVRVVGASMKWKTALTAGDLRVQKDGVTVDSVDLTSGSGIYADNMILNTTGIDFAAGTNYLQVRVENLNVSISDPTGVVYYRRKAT